MEPETEDAHKFLEQICDELMAEGTKSTERLLAEDDADTLSEEGLIILVERGFRDEMLRRSSNAKERAIVWYEWLTQQLAKQVIERGTPTTEAEMENSFVQINAKAVILAYCEPQPPSDDLLSCLTKDLIRPKE